MSLTDAQANSVRFYMGYPTTLANVSTGDNRDFAYAWVTPGVMMTLDTALQNLTTSQENDIVGYYLPQLDQLKKDIWGSTGTRANLDTDQAAVWTHNKDEVRDRLDLYTRLRRDLAGYLAFPPGPLLNSGVRVSRA